MNFLIVHSDNEMTHAVVRGQLNTAARNDFLTALKGKVLARGKPALLDFSGVTFITSTIIGDLSQAHLELAGQGGGLAVFGARGSVLTTLVTATQKVSLKIADDLESAKREVNLA